MCKPSRVDSPLSTPYHLSPHATEQLSNQELQWFGVSPHSDVARAQLDRHYVSVKRFRPREGFNKEQLGHALLRWREVASHPNIQPFIGLLDSTQGILPMLVVVHVKWNLMEYLGARPQADKYVVVWCLRFDESARYDLQLQAYYVASALEYMHRQDPPVLHGNMRASNVLVDDNGGVYLSDIGIHEAIYSKDQPRHGIRWRAPEQILHDEPHTAACDVWGFAMTVLEMYTGVHPFENYPHEATVVLAMGQGEIPRRPQNSTQFDDGLWVMLTHCWSYSPPQRPTMSTVLPWIRLLKEISQLVH